MIRHTCCHSRVLGPEDSIFATAESFVGPDQILAGMPNLAFNQRIKRTTAGAFRARCASHRLQSRLERSICAVLIVWLGVFSNCARPVSRFRGSLCVSTLINLCTLARLENRGIIQINISALNCGAAQVYTSELEEPVCETAIPGLRRNVADHPRQTGACLDSE